MAPSATRARPPANPEAADRRTPVARSRGPNRPRRRLPQPSPSSPHPWTGRRGRPGGTADGRSPRAGIGRRGPGAGPEEESRGGRIRTGDPLLPKQVRYRTAPRPEVLLEFPGRQNDWEDSRRAGERVGPPAAQAFTRRRSAWDWIRTGPASLQCRRGRHGTACRRRRRPCGRRSCTSCPRPTEIRPTRTRRCSRPHRSCTDRRDRWCGTRRRCTRRSSRQ